MCNIKTVVDIFEDECHVMYFVEAFLKITCNLIISKVTQRKQNHFVCTKLANHFWF